MFRASIVPSIYLIVEVKSMTVETGMSSRSELYIVIRRKRRSKTVFVVSPYAFIPVNEIRVVPVPITSCSSRNDTN